MPITPTNVDKFQLKKLNFDYAKAVYNKPVSANNALLKVAQKAAYVFAAVLVAAIEVFINAYRLVANVGITAANLGVKAADNIKNRFMAKKVVTDKTSTPKGIEQFIKLPPTAAAEEPKQPEAKQTKEDAPKAEEKKETQKGTRKVSTRFERNKPKVIAGVKIAQEILSVPVKKTTKIANDVVVATLITAIAFGKMRKHISIRHVPGNVARSILAYTTTKIRSIPQRFDTVTTEIAESLNETFVGSALGAIQRKAWDLSAYARKFLAPKKAVAAQKAEKPQPTVLEDITRDTTFLSKESLVNPDQIRRFLDTDSQARRLQVAKLEDRPVVLRSTLKRLYPELFARPVDLFMAQPESIVKPVQMELIPEAPVQKLGVFATLRNRVSSLAASLYKKSASTEVQPSKPVLTAKAAKRKANKEKWQAAQQQLLTV
jgi:hypothetical protein